MQHINQLHVCKDKKQGIVSCSTSECIFESGIGAIIYCSYKNAREQRELGLTVWKGHAVRYTKDKSTADRMAECTAARIERPEQVKPRIRACYGSTTHAGLPPPHGGRITVQSFTYCTYPPTSLLATATATKTADAAPSLFFCCHRRRSVSTWDPSATAQR